MSKNPHISIRSVIAITVIVFIALTISGTPLSRAQDLSDLITEEDFCAADLQSFMSAAVGYDGFVDYWKDLFRNTCHRGDIGAVQMQVEKARQQVRAAYLRCDRPRITPVKETYYRLDAELFFVRNFITTDTGEIITKSRGELAKEMRNFFVLDRNFFSQEELEQLIATFETKYADRMDQYNDCDDPTFEELSEKWDELMKLFKEIGGDFEELGDAIAGEDEDELTEEEKARRARLEKRKSAKDGPEEGFWDGLLDSVKNKIDYDFRSEGALEELINAPDADEDKKPGLSGVGDTFGKVQGRIATEQHRAEDDGVRVQMLARYEVLYGQVGDEAVETLELRIDELIETLETTKPVIRIATQCADEAEEKECES